MWAGSPTVRKPAPRMPLAVLPPAYDLVTLDAELDAFERAVRLAPRGLDDGTVYWVDRADRLDMAVVLEPEAPAATTLESLYVMTVAAGDTLEALRPRPGRIAYAWPGDILIGGVRVGRVRAALAPVAGAEAIPPWLVLGLQLTLPGSGQVPQISSRQLLGSVARRFLQWTGRWLDDGLAPVRDVWNRRCYRGAAEGELVLGGERISGVIEGLAADGAFVIGSTRLAPVQHLASLD